MSSGPRILALEVDFLHASLRCSKLTTIAKLEYPDRKIHIWMGPVAEYVSRDDFFSSS